MSTMTPRRSSRKQQVWLYVIAALFCADFVFCGYMPSHKRLQSLREAQRQQQRLIETAAAQGKELPALKARLASVEQIVAHYESYVPREASLALFLQDIARTMTEHHLTDQVVVPSQEVGSSGVGCVPLHVNCRGSLKDVFSFFHDLQAMDRLVRIQRVILQNDRDFTGRVSMDTDAVVFYRPQASLGATPVAAGL
jgi:Tfp pilus assembly protein PilO